MARKSTKKGKKTTKKKAAPKKAAESQSQSQFISEVLTIMFFALSVFLALAIISYQSTSSRLPLGSSVSELAGSNLMGPLGHFIATFLVGSLGWASISIPLACLWISIYNFRTEKPDTRWYFASWNIISFALVVLLFSSVAYTYYGLSGGGQIGAMIANPIVNSFNLFGAVLIQCTLVALALAHLSRKSLVELIVTCLKSIRWAISLVIYHVPKITLQLIASIWRPCIGAMSAAYAFIKTRMAERKEKRKVAKPVIKNKERVIETKLKPKQDPPIELDESEVVVRRLDSSKKRFAKRKKQNNKYKDYDFPDIEILTPGEERQAEEDDQILLEMSSLIEEKLKDFNIKGKITEVHPGPVVTMFEFEPAPGVKVGKIASLQDDLAMSLRATSIRIIAPIPNKGTVGFEVPNQSRQIVRLREIIESPSFCDSEAALNVALGKDIYGAPVSVDVAKMPHLLLAGATGSGKSVCINTLLLSLLYRCPPDELGLILIDPKILELSVYDGIPHLRAPVVTVPKQAKAVLEWAVKEMNQRYRMMQQYGVRSIDGYNRMVKGETEKDHREKIKEKGIVTLDEDQMLAEGTVKLETEVIEDVDASNIPAEELQPLPKIVIVIDEMADLMLSVGRDIEDLVARLAQKARAAGIHLILATQRPSVDVITGLIKANFPARVSFRVSSRIDSRTILDSMGAERLLGMGDMLMMMPGAHHLIRVHGAYVSDEEVVQVIEELKKSSTPNYDDEIIDYCERAMEEDNKSSAGGDMEYDELYDQTIELVLNKGQASTSMIQRAFRIGYNRAARIMDTLERDGVIGPMDGSKPREVLLTADDLSERA